MIATSLTGQRVSNQEGICPFSMAAERGAVKLYEISLCANRGRQREPGGPCPGPAEAFLCTLPCSVSEPSPLSFHGWTLSQIHFLSPSAPPHCEQVPHCEDTAALLHAFLRRY